MRLRLWTFLGFTGSVLLVPLAAMGKERTSSSAIPAGADFCFLRKYDGEHLRSRPHQLVTSIQLMGRNAWKTGSSDNVYATLLVSFRDTPKRLTAHGSCFLEEVSRTPSLLCGFTPYPTQFADVLQQTLYVREATSGQIELQAAADWRVIREDKDPDEPYGKVSTDDEIFILKAQPISDCEFPKGFWSKNGPTRKFLGTLP
ncbi:hypothetical protein MHY87_13715 [Microvirga sp. ACRRW]|uniref:hypothetical protein n=1 Tax=Microvirga sp. ACRRW TaxID=2918205 RepID=UPI001EF73F07|nr:hypothetical protein [Microvirga sp. ACRRW]MCG7393963.1 hypothetical protein [Microvirga sp. ACRRW]